MLFPFFLLILRPENKSINGVLSDGKSWTFLRLCKNFLYMTEELPATTEAQQEIVLGMASSMIDRLTNSRTTDSMDCWSGD